MANFQRTTGDKTTRLDKNAATLLLVLEEYTKIDLAGTDARGLPLVVDADDPFVVDVSGDSIALDNKSSLSTYGVTGMRSGTTQVTARSLNQSYVDPGSRRRAWQTAPVLASLKVTVFGEEYRQAGGTWGNLVYGSTNPNWKNVKWTTMAEAGCGPTSLAMVLDYLERLSPAAPRGPVSISGVTPVNTMEYSSRYGRAADDKGIPQGTSGKVMMDNVSIYWPQYMSRPVLNLADAKALLRQSKPIVFLAKDRVVTWKYDKKGNRVEQAWPGHFMVVLGFEGNGDPFWIADSSRFQGKFISASELSKCAMWVVEPWGGASKAETA